MFICAESLKKFVMDAFKRWDAGVAHLFSPGGGCVAGLESTHVGDQIADAVESSYDFFGVLGLIDQFLGYRGIAVDRI